MATHASAPPPPQNPIERARVEHTRLRRRVLYSMHRGDVAERVKQSVGPTRANAQKIVDMSSNPAWYTFSQLSALYLDTPEVRAPSDEIAAAIAESGWWEMARRNQRDVCGMNDGFVRVEIIEGEPSYRLAPADLCEPIFLPMRPQQPVAMREWIQDPDDPMQWIQVVTDPRERIYAAFDGNNKDVSERILGGRYSGDAYPFIVNGDAVHNYVAYHAAETGTGLDPWSGAEVFDGALQLGVYYSFFGHILRNTAWGQRWGINVEPAGGVASEDGTREEMVADPATVALFRQLEEGANGPPQLGQWAPPVDPEKILASVERYERRLVDMALGQVGVSRRDSDVRSAMSLAVSREERRAAQRAYEPVFRRSDVRLCRLTSGLMGGPVDGWRIQHVSVPRDSAELDAELKRMTDEIAAGLLDRVTAYQQLHPGLTRAEAEMAITEIAEINARTGGRSSDTRPEAPGHDPAGTAT